MLLGRRVEEPVSMERKRYAFLPGTFLWRGRRYDVHAVERCWTMARGSGEKRVERRYFRVRCDDRVVELYHDLLGNTWSVKA